MLEKLQAVLRDFIGDQALVITGDMVLLSNFDIDSYELVMLISEIEERLGVEITDRAISGFKTVQDVLDYLERA